MELKRVMDALFNSKRIYRWIQLSLKGDYVREIEKEININFKLINAYLTTIIMYVL